MTVRLVNWADEEGARFGRSLFGSSAAAGSMADQDELRELEDRDGIGLPEALHEHGVDLNGAVEAHAQLESAAAYLELHIEQGPVLESMDAARCRARHLRRRAIRIIWRGQAAHAGSTPMDQRRDALAGAAKLALELREIAKRVGGGAVLTSGGVVCTPGIVTSVVETAEQLLDMRHLDAAKLASMWEQVREACERFAQEEQIEVEYERIWEIEPILFDETLVGLADEAIREVAGTSHKLSSGPLHDAAEVSRAGVPTVMLFVQSLRGLSHQARGHQARAHRARRPGARPSRRQDDRPGRVRLSAPPSPPAAVVFDCDGLLLETESCWTLAEEELSARYGRVFGPEEKRVLIGTSAYSGSRVLERLLDQPGRAEPWPGPRAARPRRAAAARGGDSLSGAPRSSSWS